MKCPKCRFENPEGMRFCGQCAHTLTISQAPVPDDKLERIGRYLPNGLAEKILAQRGKIEGERKQVTVMFCDMAGFTPLVQELGPDEAYSIMDRVYEILIHCVHDYQGTVNEMTGDGIMALFGAPVAVEDAPQRALRSALSIHRNIAKFSEQSRGKNLTSSIKMRIGVHTGPVVMGTLGNDLRLEFKAVGDTVNLASRMEGLAKPGTTAVTHQTFKLTKGLFHFEGPERKDVKGRKGSVPVYRLLSAKEGVYRPRIGSERMIYSEMVGRDKELARLEFQAMKTIKGYGSVVNIVGEAGIGKSRLVAELRKREVMNGVNLLEGRAIAIGGNLSFHPVIDIFKHWAEIKEDDDEASRFDKLHSLVWSICQEDAHEVLPFLATLMGMRIPADYAKRIEGIRGDALQKLILKNVRHLLSKATEMSPLVIITEDMHWADTSSLELLESLFRLAETHRIMFVNVFRAPHKGTALPRVPTFQREFPKYSINISLRPLDETKSEALLNNVLTARGLPRSIRDRIVERSGGNPFFIEEVVRSFIDDGAIVFKGKGFEITEKIHTMQVPYTITDVLTARIDRLDDNTRELVRVASVIGRSFFYKILAKIASATQGVDATLSYLKDIQLIRERMRIDEIEYLFKHALVQEVAYQSILDVKRKELHLTVADAIETVFSDKIQHFYGMLSYHYTQGGNLQKAEQYLLRAGEEALRSSASSEALSYYQEGLDLYVRKYGKAAEPDKLSRFEKNIALALFNKGKYDKAIEYFDTQLQRWGELSSRRKIISGLQLLSGFLSLVTKLYLPVRNPKKLPDEKDNEIFEFYYKKAIALVFLDSERCFIVLLSALRRLNKFNLNEVENGIRMWMSASGLFSWTGISFRLAKKILDFSKANINSNDVKDVLYFDLFDLLYKFFAGHWTSIRSYDEDLVDSNLRIGEFWHVSTYIIFHAFVKIDQGHFNESESLISKLHEIYDAYDNETAREYEISLKIKLLLKTRRLHDAKVEADAGISFQGQTGREFVILLYLGYKALIELHTRNADKGENILDEVEGLLLRKGRIPPSYISSYLMGRFLLDLYYLERAVRLADSADMAVCRKRALKSGKCALENSSRNACDRTETFRLLGLYYWILGRKKTARKYWQKSIDEGIRLNARVELARTYMEIGRRSRNEDEEFGMFNGIGGEKYLEKAAALFGEMGLEWDLEELSRTAV